MSPPTFKAASMASRRRSKLEYTLGELEGSLDNEKKARTAVEILNLRSRRGSSRATMSWLRMAWLSRSAPRGTSRSKSSTRSARESLPAERERAGS